MVTSTSSKAESKHSPIMPVSRLCYLKVNSTSVMIVSLANSYLTGNVCYSFNNPPKKSLQRYNIEIPRTITWLIYCCSVLSHLCNHVHGGDIRVDLYLKDPFGIIIPPVLESDLGINACAMSLS